MWTTEQVKAAEDRPAGAHARRRADADVPRYGLASRALAMLRDRTGGVAGRRVTLLVGAGNNGGDALWAGVLPATAWRRRDSAVLLAPDRAHPSGLAAFRRAGGRVVSSVSATRTW